MSFIFLSHYFFCCKLTRDVIRFSFFFTRINYLKLILEHNFVVILISDSKTDKKARDAMTILTEPLRYFTESNKVKKVNI
jgi:hypothetical protein